MFSTLASVLVTAAVSLAPQTPVPDLGQKFGAAARDPSLVVPLILETSELLSRVDGATGQRLADASEPFLRQVFFSPQRFPGAEKLGLREHVVASGELPGSIAKRYRIGAGLLRYLNPDYDERKIVAGRRLVVLDLSNGSLQLIVDKERCRLAAWHKTPDGEHVLSMYVPIGIGASESPTPSGTTKIVDRVRNPAWTNPLTREVHPHGDPRNLLGGYWIRLDSQGIGQSGIGLHGYTGSPAPDWIERGASNGCVRLLQSDADRVFELALEGTQVVLAP